MLPSASAIHILKCEVPESWVKFEGGSWSNQVRHREKFDSEVVDAMICVVL